MVSHGMTRLQQLFQQQLVPQYHLDRSKETANAAKTTDSEGPAPRTELCKKRKRTKAQLPLPLTFHVSITVAYSSKKTDHIAQVPQSYKQSTGQHEGKEKQPQGIQVSQKIRQERPSERPIQQHPAFKMQIQQEV